MKRILLVEDHAAFRQAIASVLEQEPDLKVVAQASSLAEGRRVDHGMFDLAMVDVFLPDGKGTHLIRQLKEANPQTPVLVLTVSPDPAVHGEALEAGADEVLPKSAELDEIVAVIRRLASD
jgi:DNA-binding NarL/FixJ family response regulator